MTVRMMEIDDLPQVMEIEEESFSVPWSKEGFFTFLTREDTMFLAVEEKGEILGYCGTLIVLDEADVLNVVVKRERRREGIGYFMMQSVMILLKEQGVRILHLEVRKGNSEALRLYERVGFVRDGLRKDYYSDPTEDAILMSMSI